jgi:uncharacterized membrane protein YphA (DoxX/SURF4 family)
MTLLGAPETGTARHPRAPSAVLDGIVRGWGSLRAMALMRLLFGLIVIRHLWPDLRAPVVLVERFHVPWWSWLPVPSPELYRGLVWLGVLAGVAMVLGLAPRLATRTAFAVVTYLVLVDMTSFAHNRGFLVWMLFGLSLLPTGGAFSLSRTEQRLAVGPLWPVLLLRIVVSTVYLTSGLTKLLNPDWRSGLVLWDRVVRHEHLIPFDGWVHDVLTARLFHQLLSPSAIAVELFVGAGLWFARTRLIAIWVALAFHVSIELTASVQTFSYSAIAALLLWVTPRDGDRVLTATPASSRLVRRLDWLRRFAVERQPVASGEPMRLVDRDGVERHGRDAHLTALSRLPLLFPVVAPALAWYRLRRRSG